jgi:tetratricopeptide (TPR) repeat protein
MPSRQPADPSHTIDHVSSPESPPTLAATAAGAPVGSTEPHAAGQPAEAPVISGYRIVGEIARGSMGRVWAAIDKTFDREVAIKTLLSGAHAERFLTEAKITARLPHPGIPPVHNLGTLPDGTPYLAMKLIRGRTLAEVLRERPSPAHDLPQAVQVFEQIAQAVGFAHRQGVVHRDLKPLNVMVGEFGEVQVMDWGLAKQGFLQYDVLQLADPATQQREGAALKYDADVRLRDVVLRAAERIEGKFPDRPLVEADIRPTLGFTLLGMGRADLAAKQFERVLDLRRKHLGPDDADTLISMNNLADGYTGQGRHAEALKLNEETLALRKAKLGPDHPDTLTAMNNLANSYVVLGRYAEALKLNEETLALRKAKLGPDHPATLTTMNNLANSYVALGRHAEALKLNEETLALRRAKLGPDHPDTLFSVHNFTASDSKLGRYAEALTLCEETLALWKAKLGPDHPDTLWSMKLHE